MATLEQIRAGLASALDAGIDDVQISAYLLANPSPPTIHIYPTEVAYDLAMHRGADTYAFTVQAIVGFTADQGAQKKLDAMLAPSGAGSVKAAIEAPAANGQRTLGGVVQDVRVVQASGYRIYTFETVAGGSLRGPVLGCDWTVSVIA